MIVVQDKIIFNFDTIIVKKITSIKKLHSFIALRGRNSHILLPVNSEFKHHKIRVSQPIAYVLYTLLNTTCLLFSVVR